MPLRAYYHDNLPGDPTTPHDSHREIPMEYLDSLGFEMFILPGPDYAAQAREYANQKGFGLVPDSAASFNYKSPEESHPMVKESVIKFNQLVDEGWTEHKVFTMTPEFWIVSMDEDCYVDIQDPVTKEWMRIDTPEGTMAYAVPGSIRRLIPQKTNRVMFLKGPVSTLQTWWGDDAVNSVGQKEYLKKIEAKTELKDRSRFKL